MTRLTIPLDFETFTGKVETLERSQRAEFIFENLGNVLGGNHHTLWKYAVEARVHWEKRCCSLMEYQTPSQLYHAAQSGKLPKPEWREKEIILRLARALRHESMYCDISTMDDQSVEACNYAEALLKHSNNKHELLALYIHFPEALRKQDTSPEILNGINRKALSIAKELGDKQQEMEVLINYGRVSELYHEYADALQYYNQALQIINGIALENKVENSPNTIPTEYLILLSNILFYIAKSELFLGNIREAVTIGNRAAAYAVRLQSDGIKVSIEQLLSRAYSTLGSHQTGLEHLVCALKTAESLKSPFLIGQTKMFIAVTYSKMGDYHRAFEHGLQGIDLLKSHQSCKEYTLDCVHVGSMMVSAGQFEKAHNFFIDLLDSIMQADKSINLEWHKSAALRQLARIEIHRKRWNEALAYLKFPLSILDDEHNLQPLILETLLIATDAYIGAELYSNAKEFALRILEISGKNNNLQNQYIAHQKLAVIFENQDDLATAYHHHKEFHRLKEQVFNNDSDLRNKNMMILLEEQEAVRTVQAERIRGYELEEEIGQISSSLVHHDQTLKEIRTTLRSMKSTNEQAEQVVNVLQSLLRSTESKMVSKQVKTYKQIDERIGTSFPSLSRVQRELCRFIVMGHSTKDIAKLMNISVSSVNTQRYRIRKKLTIQESESLNQLIKQVANVVLMKS